jgi:hypothetical protein
MEVYKSITAIIGEMAAIGIAKDSKNKTQGWQFRGIDAVYNALAPLLAKHELLILPRITNRTVCEKLTKNGGTVFYVTVDADFDFVSAKDGSKHTVSTIGEAMDSGDKATNKAMSIALKYAAFQSFFIPTEATMSDADLESYNIEQASNAVNSWVTAIKNGQTTIDDPNLSNEYKDQVRSLI